jgi:hypothetical protein
MDAPLVSRAIDVLLDYFAKARSGDVPVVRLRDGRELMAEFDQIGVPLSLSDSQVGILSVSVSVDVLAVAPDKDYSQWCRNQLVTRPLSRRSKKS